MDKSQVLNSKTFCARCFLPVGEEDRVDIDKQSFHRICSMCCICRKMPTSLKMFNGHIFCNNCFKMHVLTKFRGNGMESLSNFWTHGTNSQCPNKLKDVETLGSPRGQTKRAICARCLQLVDDNKKVTICNQDFHSNCANCCLCKKVPTNNLKIYYGQVFCEQCFHCHVLSRNRDNPSEFYKYCFEQWQNNEQFAQNMRGFMAGNNNCSPSIFMMNQDRSPFCRCGRNHSEWFSNNEPKKSVTPATSIEDFIETGNLANENCTEAHVQESGETNKNNEKITVIEKIANLTKYVNVSDVRKDGKNWKILDRDYSIVSDSESLCGWIDLRNTKKVNCLECPKCLWQCGSIYVNGKYLENYRINDDD